MIALIRSELLKYRSTRMSWGMAIAMFLTGALFSGVTAGFMLYGTIQVGGEPVDPAQTVPDLSLARMIYTGGITMGYLLTLVIGVLSIGQEFRHKTATGTFLAAPRRSRVIVAKVLSLALIAVGYGLIHLLGSVIGGGVLLALNDVALFPEPDQLLRTLGLALLVLALWSLIGLGIGVLIPNQVAALFIAVALAWIVEPILGFALTFADWGEAVARFFPSQATTATLDLYSGLNDQMAQSMGGTGDALAWWGGGLTLVAYAAVMTLIGMWLTKHRDIG